MKEVSESKKGALDRVVNFCYDTLKEACTHRDEGEQLYLTPAETLFKILYNAIGKVAVHNGWHVRDRENEDIKILDNHICFYNIGDQVIKHLQIYLLNVNGNKKRIADEKEPQELKKPEREYNPIELERALEDKNEGFAFMRKVTKNLVENDYYDCVLDVLDKLRMNCPKVEFPAYVN